MISIIIPTNNRKSNIENTLTALLRQTLSKDKFEVIVSDDGSTDQTFSLIDKFKDKLNLKYVYLYKKDAWNASRPRNYGSKLAEKYTKAYLFLDSDVLLNDRALEFYEEDLINNDRRIVIGPYDWLTPQIVTPEDVLNRFDDVINNKLPHTTARGRLGHIGKDVRTPSFEKAKSPNDLFEEIYDGLACFGGNILVPRSMFWEMGGFDEDTHCGLEDGEFGIRAWKHDFKFSYDIRCIGYHVWHIIPESRFPIGLKEQINKMNIKHFGEVDPDLGIINATKEVFKKWGIEWNVPAEWER
jgi:glycosyltransferase involved in cell wall biosynthesis